MTSRVMPDRPLIPYLLILTAWFIVAFVVGYFAPDVARQQVYGLFQEFVNQYRDLAGGSLYFFILLNNVTASLLILGSGLLLGIIPAVAVFSNGIILGVLYRQAAELLGYADAVLKVFPHGIFEIPALLLSGSYGLRLGVSVFRRIRVKEPTLLGYQIEHAFRRYFVVVFPLLVIAAAIETYFILTVP